MEVLENGKPDLVIEGQGLDLELTRRDPSAAKGQPSLTLGWESTPHTALGVCGQSLGKGSVMEVRSTSGQPWPHPWLVSSQEPGSSPQPLPCRQLPPGPESTERSVHRGGSHQQWA